MKMRIPVASLGLLVLAGFMAGPAFATNGVDSTGPDLPFNVQGAQVMNLQNGRVNVAGRVNATGSVQVGGDSSACTTANAGAIRWNAATRAFEGCDGAAWSPFNSTTNTTAGVTLSCPSGQAVHSILNGTPQCVAVGGGTTTSSCSCAYQDHNGGRNSYTWYEGSLPATTTCGQQAYWVDCYDHTEHVNQCTTSGWHEMFTTSAPGTVLNSYCPDWDWSPTD